MQIRYLLLFFFLKSFIVLAQSDKPAYDEHKSKENISVLQLLPGFDQSSLEGYTYVYSTADSTKKIEDIITQKPDFKRVKQEIPDLGKDNRYHWLQFKINSHDTLNQELVSYLQFNELTDVCFYVVDDKDEILYKQEHLGRKTYISRKPILTRFFAFPISLSPNQNLTIYWRIYRNQSHVVFPFRLYTKDAFFSYNMVYDFFAYISYGVLAFAFLLSTILFISNRNKLFYFYAGYCLFYLLLCFNNEGVLVQYFHINIPFLDENIRPVITGLLLYYIITFSQRFLQIERYAPAWFCQYSNILSITGLGFAFFTLIVPLNSTITSIGHVIILCVLLTVLIMIALGMTKKKREAFVYFIAIAPFFLSSIWYMLSILFRIPTTWFYYQTIPYAPFIEMVILGVELGHKLITDRDQYFFKLNRLQKEFTSSILQTQDSERERIAADLHDDLGGTISTIRRRITDIKLRLLNHEVTRDFEELEPLIQKSGDDLRRIAHNLMPPEFARIGLSGSLHQLVMAIPREPTRFEFLTAGKVQELPLEVELNAYRIVSELIQNIFKHAHAKQATVQLLFHDHYLQILVEDDGLGDQKKNGLSIPGMGLKNSKLRADFIGAELRREVSHAGTLVILNIPYAAN